MALKMNDTLPRVRAKAFTEARGGRTLGNGRCQSDLMTLGRG
jgi:hypothetical protein